MTKYVELTKLKQSKELRRESIWTFDTETKDGLKGKELFCWSLATSKGGKKRKVKQFVGSTMHEFFKILSDLNDKSHKQVIFVHNLGFDCRFLIDYCLQNAIEYFPVIVGSNVILLYITDLNYTFIDSFQFLLTSQEKAEKDWEIESELTKIDCNDIFAKNYADWTKSEKNRVIAHNRNDTLALQQILTKFRQTYFEVANVDLLQANTLAGLSMKAFRKCMDENIVNPFIFQKFDPKTKRFFYEVNTEKAEFVRKAYFGGRTECFDHNILSNCYYLDTVSMFPFNMKDKLYPSGIPTWEKDPKKILESLDSKLSIIEAKIIPNLYCNFPPLPAKINNRTIFPNCNLHGNWTSIEIQKAIELGYVVKPIKALIFPDKSRPFMNFVEKFFKVKSESKGGKRLTAKITLNSCYGKFGQKFETDSIRLYVFHTEYEAVEFYNDSIDNDYKCELKFNEFYQKWICERKEKTNTIKAFQIISFATFITAYSRIHLLNKILQLESENKLIAYCDTDSIVTNNLEGIELSKNLGGWDIEQEFKSFYCIAPKCYVAIKKDGSFLLKVKGIRKSKLKEIEQSCKTIEEIKLALSNEIELDEQYLPIKSALRLEHNALSSRPMVKKMSLLDEKRITLPNLTTRPLVDTDLLEIENEENVVSDFFEEEIEWDEKI